MNVVVDTANAEAFASGVACHRCEISEQFGADGFGEDRRAIFSAEYNVDDDERERLRHRESIAAAGIR